MRLIRLILTAALIPSVLLLAACGSQENLPTASAPEFNDLGEPPLYKVGPGDVLTIFVWGQPELSTTASIRPDGRISTPLIKDLYVSGKTPEEVAVEIETALGEFVVEPNATVIVGGGTGTFDQQVRILGAAVQPQAVPYQANMTALDLMIAVGGLTQFANGNSSTLVRIIDGEQKEYRVRLDDLVRDGDITANVAILPGDVLIIPESFF